ncbi:MAG: hypothetical protein NTX75_18315 [Proteobacteria bacterium]|nr:hypothetical protein [Pseudomonadota bacterium]
MKENKSYDVVWLNSLPVNGKAKEMLIQTGEKPDPVSMYAVQLAKWGVEGGRIEAESPVLETVEAMITWRPVRLVNFFMINSDEDYNPAGWEDAQTPLDLATVILDEIEEKMMLHFPLYGSL